MEKRYFTTASGSKADIKIIDIHINNALKNMRRHLITNKKLKV